LSRLSCLLHILIDPHASFGSMLDLLSSPSVLSKVVRVSRLDDHLDFLWAQRELSFAIIQFHMSCFEGVHRRRSGLELIKVHLIILRPFLSILL
jgi:hypothetical protein